MQLALWFVVCVSATVLLTRRPVVVVLMAVTLWCLVPGVAGHQLTGQTSGVLALQPAVVLVLVATGVRVLYAPRSLRDVVRARPEWTVLLAMVAAVSLVTGYLNGLGHASITTGVNQVLGPVLLFFLIGAAVLEQPAHVELIRRWLIGLASLEAVIALAQKLTGSTLLYASDYDGQVFRRTSPDRWMGTFDHPLVLSLFLCLAIFWLTGLRRTWLAMTLMVLFAGGILMSQSRVGTGVAVAGTLYFVLRARVPLDRRVAVLVVVVAAAAVAVRLGVVDSLLARVQDDTGSSTARKLALEYFAQHFDDYRWFGHGLNASFDVSGGAGLGTSFESAFLMYTIDLGFVVAVLYFGVMLWTVVRAAGRSYLPGIAGGAAVAVVVPQTFSALSGVTAAPALVWTACALAGFCTLGRPRSSAGAGRPHPVSARRQHPGSAPRSRGQVPAPQGSPVPRRPSVPQHAPGSHRAPVSARR
ncbi:O-antigen ligase family protein [Pedococcus sp. KACC 23699]|uniref:O-antigen ligase family protein n=1 Tax=Pedococcus sp. KACC 23699 TaxID=3149228 RepID=A0AAU7JWP1_9MICO